jgi:hypothetical protein
LLVLLEVLLAHVRIEFLRLVAVKASDVGRSMATHRPIGKNPWSFHFMALNAGLSSRGHAALDSKFFRLCKVALDPVPRLVFLLVLRPNGKAHTKDNDNRSECRLILIQKPSHATPPRLLRPISYDHSK